MVTEKMVSTALAACKGKWGSEEGMRAALEAVEQARNRSRSGKGET